ncbi:putative lyase [Candidatus Methylomirabilis lanthanidiphila]|uniref:Putative lyase n=1 Tax=Candidatus Methylomirabilis lanthanidiphila TaxID=2211376 RepID=A0A564ZM62_9BACT|nr:HEAT repeat domain-containing protein [Candidatus Methylomirabilis lanthanidiphila]VUZ86419.1 putative lyase [Candidatus Methylomirabilis lanthanidiphila]
MTVPHFMCRFTWVKISWGKSACWLISALSVAAIFALFLAVPSYYRVQAPVALIGTVKPSVPPLYSDSENRSFATGAEHTPAAIVSALIQGKSVRDASAESVSGLAAILLDPSKPLKVRRQAAWSLGKTGSTDAIAALRQALMAAPPSLKSTIAEALGHSRHPQARSLLLSLLQDDDETVVRGAVRGLAVTADRETVTILSAIIGDQRHSHAVRTEAALALGEVGTPEAYESLITLGGNEQDRDIAEAVLSGLGRQSFDQTEDFFRAYLGSTRVDSEMRILALESLGQATGDAAPFLATFLTSKDADVRAAAAWSIANLEEPADVAQALVDRLRIETQPEVRARMYQALENQEHIDSTILFPLIVSDGDTAARLAGMMLLATQVAFGEGDPALAKQFDEVMTPQLAELSINGQNFQIRLGSVIALRQARTAQSLQALDAIAIRSREAQIAQAAQLK